MQFARAIARTKIHRAACRSYSRGSGASSRAPGTVTSASMVEAALEGPVKPTGRTSARAPASRADDRLAIALLVSIPLGITAWGASYYFAPLDVRVRHALHSSLRASGTVGLALGVVAFALFLFLWLYPVRKALPALAWTGSVGAWLRVHILAGIAVPLFAAVHAGWRFTGLIGLGYASLLLVAMSGAVGRYLYVRIPRRRDGLELSREEAANERRTLLTEIAAESGEDPLAVERDLAVEPGSASGAGPLAILRRLVADDWRRRRRLAALRRRWATPPPGGPGLDRSTVRRLTGLARRELRLAQQIEALEATRRVFALWHVVHRPFAILAFLAVVIHVAVAVVVAGIHPFAGH